jgi:hypothetical protein
MSIADFCFGMSLIIFLNFAMLSAGSMRMNLRYLGDLPTASVSFLLNCLY